MTIQELKDLVLQKIAGQGSQIDVGGALPPVLNGILDTLAATQNVDSVEVTVDEGIGTPSADVTFTDGVLTIAFHNLKGEKGDKGDQGNTGSSVDYPFELVNNLTTDDATKALSAAQGVVLDGKISQLQQEVTADISQLDQQLSIPIDPATLEKIDLAYITSAGKWTSSTGRNGSYIPVKPGMKVSLVGGALIVRYAYLTDAVYPVAGGTPPYVPGTTVNALNPNSSIVVTIPSGCNYLQINRVYNDDDYAPESINLIGEKIPAIESEVVKLNSLAQKHDAQIGNTQTLGVPFYTIENGTLQNNANANRVRLTEKIAVNPGDAVSIIINKTLPSGNYWVYGWRVYDNNDSVIVDVATATTSTNNTAIIPQNGKNILFCIGMNNSEDSSVTLRKTDFAEGDLEIEIVPGTSILQRIAHLESEDYLKAGVKTTFIGAGTTFVVAELVYNFAPGQAYRCVFLNPNVELVDTSGGNYRFQLAAHDKNGAVIEYIRRYSTAESLPNYIDFIVPEGTNYIRVGGRCKSGEEFPVIFFPISASDVGIGILGLNPESEFQPKFLSAKKRYYTSTDGNRPSPLVVMHLSDIHGNWNNVARFIEFSQKYESYIDELVNTGDTVSSVYADGVDGYSALDGVGDIINVIGNHDTREGNDWQSHIGVDAYNLLIKPFVSGWGVTQPTGAEENGYCYFYKDYAEKNIRMVFVDIMSYDGTQDSWLSSVLSEARTNGYHIVIFTHFSGARNPSELNERVFDKVACNYTTLYSVGEDSVGLSGYNDESYKMNDTVADFIDAGGHFVGYVQGHYHADFVSKSAKYPNQLIYSIGATKAGEMRDFNHIVGTRDQDEFQIISIDPVSTIVKLYKVGANYDRYGRKKGSVCVDYTTGQVLGEGW